jgi:hypothetical protein
MKTYFPLKILLYPLLSGLLIFLLFSVYGCAWEKGPSGAIIEAARQRTITTINSVAQNREMIMSQSELLEDHYNNDLQQYVLKSHLKSEYGLAFADSPVAYIFKEGNRWKYRFQFGGLHESYFTTNS